ncbi:peptide deformylase [bacterium]|nr:peptide deformylase [bacterium]
MPELDLILYPDPRLRKVSEPVKAVTPELLARVRDMFPVMYEAKGIGLAAPQVGWNVRLFLMNVSGEPQDEIVLLNPVVVESSKAFAKMEEGCLSLPEIRGQLERPARLKVQARAVTGAALRAAGSKLEGVPVEDVEIEADGLVARCIQHEMDHLNGVLIIDLFSPAKKQAIKARLRELESEFKEQVPSRR